MAATALYALWIASIASRLVLLALLAKRRLLIRYPGLSLMLVGTLAITALRASASGTPRYGPVWYATEPFSLALVAVIALECYVVQARHCVRFAGFGTYLAFLLAFTAALLITLSLSVWPEMLPEHAAWMGRTRSYSAILLVFSVLTQGFFRAFRIELRPNAQHYVFALDLLLFADAALNVIMDGWAMSLFLMTLSVAAFAVFCLLRPETEKPPVSLPGKRESRAAAHRKALRDAIKESRAEGFSI